MTKGIILPFALMLVVAAAMAQLHRPTDSLRIGVDFARFRGDEKSSYVEVYYLFSPRSLTYRPDSAGLRGGIDLTLIARDRDSVVYADRWLVPHAIADTSELRKTMNLVNMSNMMLPPGSYSLHATAKDANNPKRVFVDSLTLRIKGLDTSRVTISDIELASIIRREKRKSMFYKNTFEVVPNASGLYGYDQKVYYYGEAYGLLTGADRSDYAIKTAVYDALGREVISREKPRKRVGESTVIADSIGVDKMRTGTYTLVLSIVDSSRKALSASGKKFFVYNQVLGIDSSLINLGPRVAVNEFTTMDETELDREFSWARYEARDEEKEQFKQLKGVDAKRKFLYEFWRRRELGKRDEYIQRVKYSNSAYQALGRDGFKADRGRVHIMYGQPDDIDRHPNEPDSRPYEIWQYNNIQGGVVFVFVLRQNGGDYELVHSTHRNELHDENWQRYAVQQ